MSLRDIERSRAVLESFKGRRCFATLATNSIKFRFGDGATKGRYIWIDPSWVYSREWGEITSSDAYTDETFRAWCELFDALRETVFEHFEEAADGSLTLHFSGGYRLFVPAQLTAEEDRDLEYDHWYACDEKGA